MAELSGITMLRDDRGEWKRHESTIEKLSEQSGVSRVEIGRIYAAELERLRGHVRIREFLPILIGRRVKDNLNKHGS